MSDIAHTNPSTLPVRLRPGRFIKLAAAVLVVVAIVVAVAVFVVDDGGSGSPAAATPATSVSQPTGVRYDGGPEEGTRGPAASTPDLDTRYDGGPEEGTRGLGH
jgi:hypothetical protein